MSEYRVSRLEALTFPLSAGLRLMEPMQYRKGNDNGSGYVQRCVQREVARTRRYLNERFTITAPPPKPDKQTRILRGI